MQKQIKFNTVQAGIIPGLVLPVITFALIGVIGNHGNLWEFIRIIDELDRIASLISLSVIPNLLLFFVCIWTSRLHAARGVLLATFIFAVTMLIFKFT